MPTPSIWIPGSPDIKYKIQIISDTGTTYTLADSYSGASTSNYLIQGSITGVATDSLGSFKLQIANKDGLFYGKFNGGELIHFYADTSTATTKIFTAVVDNVKYGLETNKGFFVEIDGRTYPELIDKSVSGMAATMEGTGLTVTTDVLLARLLYDKYPNVKLNYWNGSAWIVATLVRTTGYEDTVTWSSAATGFPTTAISMSWQHKKGWTVINEVCKRAELDCYLDYDISSSQWNLRVFNKGAITNTNAGIAYGVNLINVSPYGIENTEVINRVIGYGKTEGDYIILLKTEDDTASQANLWVKDTVINEDDLTTMQEIQSKVSYELSKGVNIEANGRITAIGLPALRPGDTISCSVPYTGIYGNYRVQDYTHNIGPSFTTTLNLSKHIKSVTDLFVGKTNADDTFIGGGTNLDDMKDSYTVYFNETPSVMTHSGTEEVDEKLQLTSGNIFGVATSNVITTDYDVTYCEMRVAVGNYNGLDKYYVSNNGGSSWTELILPGDSIHEFSVPSNQLQFKIELNRSLTTDPSPVYDSVCVLYK